MLTDGDMPDGMADLRSRFALTLARLAFLIVKLMFWPLVLAVLASRAIVRHSRRHDAATSILKLDRAGGDGGAD